MSEAENCIRCHHPAEKNEKFCIQCGAPLKNKCTNDGGPLGDPCSKTCAHHAKFCTHCGAETLFHKQGLLQQSHYPAGGFAINEDNEMENYFTHPFFRP